MLLDELNNNPEHAMVKIKFHNSSIKVNHNFLHVIVTAARHIFSQNPPWVYLHASTVGKSR